MTLVTVSGGDAWREEETALMRRMWNVDNATAADICDALRSELGSIRSRSAVLGYMSRHRDDFLLRAPLRSRNDAKPRRTRTTKPAAVTRPAPPVIVAPPVDSRPRVRPSGSEAEAYDSAALCVPLAQLTGRQCRFPVNDAAPGQQHLFCGHAATATGPYCDHHAARAFDGTVRQHPPASRLRWA